MGSTKEEDCGGEKKIGDVGGANAVVLKVDMHCEGCADKIIKYVQGFEGVESVKADGGANKLTVVGRVDPSALRDKVANKTKKKVDLISQSPGKDKESKPSDKKSGDDKKPKEVPSTTAVLKVGFHCQGCIKKIHKAITKTQGVEEIWMDKEKELVTVKGTMDVKALCECLRDRVKREVEVVAPKKDKEGGNAGGGKKKGGGGGGEEEEEIAGIGKMEGNRMEAMAGPWYGLTSGYEYGYGAGGHAIHPPQTFSDENPNACSVM